MQTSELFSAAHRPVASDMIGGSKDANEDARVREMIGFIDEQAFRIHDLARRSANIADAMFGPGPETSSSEAGVYHEPSLANALTHLSAAIDHLQGQIERF